MSARGFEDFKIKWMGVEYKIPSTNMFAAINAVEEVITFSEVTRAASTGNVKMSQLSRAFGALLRIAGADVTDEQVYHGMWDKENPDRGDIMSCMLILFKFMVPESAAKTKILDGGKKNDVPLDTGKSGSSRKRSRQQSSAAAG